MIHEAESIVLVVLLPRTWCLVVLLGCMALRAPAQTPVSPSTAIDSDLLMLNEIIDADLVAAKGTSTDCCAAAAPMDATGAKSSKDAMPADTPPPHGKPDQPSQGFQWKPAVAQYFLEISIQHAWRFAHEEGTRDATGNGHWFQNWMASIGETRGWDDGDGWHASYVAHPLNGGIYGFIEQQNDPLYRNVEWGDGRIYWLSRLRALAFAAIASTQWTLGPMSEASLGAEALHSSPGFIDLVNTPGLGIMEMMGEDMLDRYVIIPLENHTANPWLILAARSLGNPARSFANLMAFKNGWHRETRPGIFGENHAMRKQAIWEYKHGLSNAPFGPHTAEERAEMNKAVEKPPSLLAPIELEAYALYTAFPYGDKRTCLGGGGQGAARIAPSWQIISEVNGCMTINTPYAQSGDSLTFGAGPRWTPHAAEHRLSPFAQVLFGGQRITYEIVDPVKENDLITAYTNGEPSVPHYPKRSDYSVQYQALGFNMTMGGGLDVAFGRPFVWRLLEVDYSHSWLPPVHGINASQGVQVRTGVVLRIGTW